MRFEIMTSLFLAAALAGISANAEAQQRPRRGRKVIQLAVTNGFEISDARASAGLAANNSFQFNDDLTMVRGRHEMAFGVNLAAAPEGLDQVTISLRSVLPPDALAPEPLAFLARVRPKLEAWSTRIEREGFEPLRAAWLSRAHG